MLLTFVFGQQLWVLHDHLAVKATTLPTDLIELLEYIFHSRMNGSHDRILAVSPRSGLCADSSAPVILMVLGDWLHKVQAALGLDTSKAAHAPGYSEEVYSLVDSRISKVIRGFKEAWENRQGHDSEEDLGESQSLLFSIKTVASVQPCILSSFVSDAAAIVA